MDVVKLIELLRERAMVGRMEVRDKQLMIMAADALERQGEWIVTENGCVINCSECGYRLELCYPDGTEVRWLPNCPNCGASMKDGE